MKEETLILDKIVWHNVPDVIIYSTCPQDNVLADGSYQDDVDQLKLSTNGEHQSPKHLKKQPKGKVGQGPEREGSSSFDDFDLRYNTGKINSHILRMREPDDIRPYLCRLCCCHSCALT